MYHQVAIVGAGFGGIAAAISLRRRGIDVVILEREDQIGGTWRDNRYPGCRCDVSSHLYSYSFAPNPNWSSTFASQGEIWDYLWRVFEDHGLEKVTKFGIEVTSATFSNQSNSWLISTNEESYESQYLILATGPLSNPKFPDIEGLESFEGRVVHTGMWDETLDFKNSRVAVIGTGASAIQLVPAIAKEVETLHLFQRTPPWIFPHPNQEIPATLRDSYRRYPLRQRLVRYQDYWRREILGYGLTSSPDKLESSKSMALEHMRASISDPELVKKLTPTYIPGCKRLLISNDYYPALNQENIKVITDPIERIKKRSVYLKSGRQIEVDVIVCATGFDATHPKIASVVYSPSGQSLSDYWKNNAMTAYLGTAVGGFPNMFILAGPNTGIGHTSVVFMTQAQLHLIVDLIIKMRSSDKAKFVVKDGAQRRFNELVAKKMAKTVWITGGCKSWYLDEDGRNTTLWPASSWEFFLRSIKAKSRDFIFE